VHVAQDGDEVWIGGGTVTVLSGDAHLP
jgi:hypothetical protein